jgi:HlyD family secretion protein
MIRQLQIWGMRVLMIGLIIYVGHRWGMPLYRQYFAPKKTTIYVPTAPVREGPFVVSFHDLGALKAERSVSVSPEIEAKIIYLAPEGSMVKPGDKLVEFDTTELQRRVRERELALSNAEAEVRRAKAELEILMEENKTRIAQAKATLQFNEAERDAAKEQRDSKVKLANDKLIPKTEAEQAEINLRAKELQVEKGKMDLTLQEKDAQSKESQKMADVRTKEFARDMARIDLEEAQRHLKRAVLTAPAAGMVVLSKIYTPEGRRKVKEGDTPWRRMTLVTLPDLRSMQVEVAVGESDAPKLYVGMPTLIRLEAVRNKVYHGVITDISSLATEQDPGEGGATPGKKNFDVTVQIKESDPKTLKPGMTADVEFIVRRIEKALYVPIEAVIERNGQTYVFVKEGKNWRRTPVKTGAYNDNFVCILRGLRKGDLVALRDPTKPLEQQEAGSTAPGAEKPRDEKTTSPIPVPTGK